jgi:hypothetical protein
MTILLDKVLNVLIPTIPGSADDLEYARLESLDIIRKNIQLDGPYGFASNWGVLVNNSAEDFMIQFMTVYNREVACTY